MSDLQPTLWRTCRILANKRRLACLRAVLTLPGATVEEIAEQARLPADQASLCLRALQSRGLLHAERTSRWVRYTPVPDRSVPIAAPILRAMHRALLCEGLSDSAVFETLTAFTHPRRLVILSSLSADTGQPVGPLARQTSISPQALWRHLGKLSRRNLVVSPPDGWRLADGPSSLAQALLALITSGRP